MKIIYTKKGQEIFVDDEDYEEMNQYSWSLSSGYALRSISFRGEAETTFLMHRIIMNPEVDKIVDHINGNRIDNRKQNLRICTNQENSWNHKIHKHSISGVSGVRWDKRSERWDAIIFVNYKHIYLGSFSSIEDAVNARKKAEIKYFGEFRSDSINEDLFKEASKRETKVKKSGRETLQSNNISGVIGVSFVKSLNRWKSSLSVDEKRIYLGTFENLEDAKKARLDAEMKYLGKIVEGNIEQC